MKTVLYWRWWVTDPDSGRRYRTRHHMTEADALATDPAAERDEATRIVREVPESPGEHEMTGAWRNKPPAP